MRKYSKIGFITLFIGWFPFMFLSVGAKYLSDPWQITILVLGILLCAFGGFTVTVFFQDSSWWESKEKLDEMCKETIANNQRATNVIRAVEIIAVKKAGFTKEELDKQIEKING